MILELADVSLEADFEFHQPGPKRAQLGSFGRRQVLAGAAEFALPMVEEPGTLAGDVGCFPGCGEGSNGRVEIVPEWQLNAPFREQLLGGRAGFTDLGVGMDVPHERSAAVADRRLAERVVQGSQRPVEGRTVCGAVREAIRPAQGVVRRRIHRLGRDGGVVERDPMVRHASWPSVCRPSAYTRPFEEGGHASRPSLSGRPKPDFGARSVVRFGCEEWPRLPGEQPGHQHRRQLGDSGVVPVDGVVV